LTSELESYKQLSSTDLSPPTVEWFKIKYPFTMTKHDIIRLDTDTIFLGSCVLMLLVLKVNLLLHFRKCW